MAVMSYQCPPNGVVSSAEGGCGHFVENCRRKLALRQTLDLRRRESRESRLREFGTGTGKRGEVRLAAERRAGQTGFTRVCAFTAAPIVR